MPMYSGPGKIICILKESSVQLMITVSRGFCPRIKFGPPFKACSIVYDDFKPPTPHLLVHLSLMNRKVMARRHV